jgi:indole-3-acetate monooxygenase
VLWCFLPKSSAVVDSSWPVNGLKGTASFGFAVKQLFIPEDMTLAYRVSAANPPLYRMPLNLMFACGFASVALGVSRGALDFAIRRTREKTKRFDRGAMSTHESVQVQVGRAEALWQSADTFLTHRVRQVWDDLVAGSPLTDEHRISMRMVGTHVIRQCKDVTDIAYAQCSTDSIFTGNEIQRRFQDMHVITQHLQGRPEVYGVLGRYYLGEPFDSPLIS